MPQRIYLEKALKNHPRVEAICARFPQAQIIECEHYQEVFNPKSQNFRLQKQDPALILAQKFSGLVLKTPESFGIGGQQNYYFSHMLNCVYDCRYCFLQGMYRSANYVLFVNYEDYMREIAKIIKNSTESAYFFSGYDCDSLAYEAASGFLHEFLPFFRQHPQAILELRTKSVNVRELLQQAAFDNCVVAFSFTPHEISEAVEHKVPSVTKRIDALHKCAEHGWRIGLRFDPLIYTEHFINLYHQLIETIFNKITEKNIHSVSIGPLRFPEKMYQNMVKLYPHDKLLAEPLQKRAGYVSYRQELEIQMKAAVIAKLQQYVSKTLLFECSPL